jgi:hypothetical protein
MQIDGETRLSQVLDSVPGSLDYIVGLNPHDFERLRNPVLRRYMASRISLRRVAAIASTPEETVVGQLRMLAGGNGAAPSTKAPVVVPMSPKTPPPWMAGVDRAAISWVDLMAVDTVGGDPFPAISLAVRQLEPGQVLGIRHRWEPQPFYDIWSRMSLEWYAEPGVDGWQIFVYRPADVAAPPVKPAVMSEVGNLPPAEVVPRVVGLARQLRPGQTLEVGGLPESTQALRADVLAQLGPGFTWQLLEVGEQTRGRRVARIMRA